MQARSPQKALGSRKPEAMMSYRPSNHVGRQAGKHANGQPGMERGRLAGIHAGQTDRQAEKKPTEGPGAQKSIS